MKKTIKKFLNKTRKNISAIIVLLSAWIVFTNDFSFISIFIGFIVSTIPIYLFPSIFAEIITPKAIKRIPFLLVFLIYMLLEVLLASFKMAYFTINPNITLKSSILSYKYNLNYSTSIFFLTTVITLTPGTLVLEIDQPEKTLYIHSLDYFSKDKADILSNVELMERWMRRIFE